MNFTFYNKIKYKKLCFKIRLNTLSAKYLISSSIKYFIFVIYFNIYFIFQDKNYKIKNK